MTQTLAQQIEDARCDLEEANDSGDLEDRLEAAQRLARLERIQTKQPQLP